MSKKTIIFIAIIIILVILGAIGTFLLILSGDVATSAMHLNMTNVSEQLVLLI